MKKILLLILTIVFTLCVYGCNKKKNDKHPDNTITPNNEVVRNNLSNMSSPVTSFSSSNITIAISGPSEVKSGKSITLNAKVTNATSDSSVIWEVVEGSDYASIDNNGVLSANVVAEAKIITVKATSNEDSKVFTTKVVTIVTKEVLTQSMLDILDTDTISFDGYINIELYTTGKYPEHYGTYINTIKTAMDGTNWYAEYDNAETGTKMGMYYKNHNSKACEIGLNFMNEEQYYPMIDDKDNHEVSFIESGLYNNLKNLKVSDFTFNEESWRYQYVGSDAKFLEKVVASANPYNFIPVKFELIIEEDEILGIYMTSDDDYSIVDGYRGVQELICCINTGSTVDVKTISKFDSTPEHEDLRQAIANMQALDKYQLQYKELVASYLTNGYTEAGYTETITPNYVYFEPFKIGYKNGEETHDKIPYSEYGFKKINENLYNAFITSNDADKKLPIEEYNKNYKLKASRAYASSFKDVWPSFAFAPEIFRRIEIDPENENRKTYYVDEIMCNVASCFYYGLGNDANLYGIFAAKGMISQTESFTPYVVVEDGYITDACFYFYLGSLYGVVELEYSNFNSEEISDTKELTFETRNVPKSWDELTIFVSSDSGSTQDDDEKNAKEVLIDFFDDEEICNKLPFFGNVLGDTYGFGLTTIRKPGEDKNGTHVPAIDFYYDVPLGIDYSIDQPLEDIGNYLLELGFIKNQYGEYYKGNIYILPVDSSLDLNIYVWSYNK